MSCLLFLTGLRTMCAYGCVWLQKEDGIMSSMYGHGHGPPLNKIPIGVNARDILSKWFNVR